MMIIGAVTRLTESGLSMVEWRPLIGALPPMNEAEWQRVFEIYQQTPEYQKKNFWMEIDDFKRIFFWEWFHRLWGRMIGLVFALPLLFFWIKKVIPQGYNLKLLGMLFLGGMQGIMGWYMVESGLVDIPAVSHYRLAAHLSLAFVILGLLLWLAFSLSIPKNSEQENKSLFLFGVGSLAITSVTIIWGAFTAGLDGGLIYNTWPLMGETFVPAELQSLATTIDSPVGVQFTHRWIAIIAGLSVIAFWHNNRKHNGSLKSNNAMALMVFLQIILGITTLLSGVNIVLAAMHQAGAAILIGLIVLNIYKLKPSNT